MPESQNFALLNRNIFQNQLDDLISAYSLAVSDRTSVDQLFLSSFQAGQSCHNFGERINYAGENFSPVYKQGCVAQSLDTLMMEFGFPLPDHIKIDVDGIEHRVIE